MFKHFFSHGHCLFCGKPIDFLKGAYPWRGGWLTPPQSEQEDCEAHKRWHQEAEKNARKELNP